jgi:HTH-type transcriptional regulator / antitoxin HigA
MIKNDEQYNEYLARIYELMQADLLPDSKEYDELDLLANLVIDYEKIHFPLK